MPPKTKNGINSKKRRKKNSSVEKSPPPSASTIPSSPASTALPPRVASTSPPPLASIASPPAATVEATPHSPSEISSPRPAATSPPPPTENEEYLNLQDNDDGDTQPTPPTKFFFNRADYTKWCRLSSRSEENKTIAELNEILGEDEKDWFRLHPQFKHIWHMHREENHKYTGMWLLLLRTVCMDKDRVCWFVVNGVPIRYLLREHGLLCGLDCRIYPPAYEKLGSDKFVKRNFGKGGKGEEEEEEEEVEATRKKIMVRIKDVKEKLRSMDACGDRLKMAILLFLSIVIAPSKKYGYIDPFLLRILEDVCACETFPWGRYTFDDTITNIFHMMQHFDGRVNSSWCFPGFLTLLEILACECIPNLKSRFRVDIGGSNTNCPRMCKQKWIDSHMKGYPIEDVNNALGTTTEIHSILEPELSEVPLMARITEDDNIQSSDPLAMSWEQSLCIEKKKICWKNLHDLDVASRGPNATEDQHEEDEIIPPQSSRAVKSLKSLESKLMRVMNAGFKDLSKMIDNRFKPLDRRVKDLELCVYNALDKGKRLSFDGEASAQKEDDEMVDVCHDFRGSSFRKHASMDGEMGFEEQANVMNGEGSTGKEADAMDGEASGGKEADAMDGEASTGKKADEMDGESSAGKEADEMDGEAVSGKEADAIDGEASAGYEFDEMDGEASAGNESDEMDEAATGEEIDENRSLGWALLKYIKKRKRIGQSSKYLKSPYTMGRGKRGK